MLVTLALRCYTSDSRLSAGPALNWFAPQGNQLAATAFGRFAPLRFHALNGQVPPPRRALPHARRCLSAASLFSVSLPLFLLLFYFSSCCILHTACCNLAGLDASTDLLGNRAGGRGTAIDIIFDVVGHFLACF